MHRLSYNIINGITVYRIFAAPVLVILIFTKQLNVFSWLLAVSFFTDLIDGFLARKFKVVSILGAKLDSIGDDLTILAALTGLLLFKPGFIKEERVILLALFLLFVFQTAFALMRYGKITSYHTYLAKIAAILQGSFLILVFFLPAPLYFLFYAAAFITGLELLEEIMLVMLLPRWKTNVKGLYWAIKK